MKAIFATKLNISRSLNLLRFSDSPVDIELAGTFSESSDHPHELLLPPEIQGYFRINFSKVILSNNTIIK